MRYVAVLGLVVNVWLCGWALLKSFHIEPTHEAVQAAELGGRMAMLAVPGLLAAVVGLVRRRWLLVCTALSLVLAAAATLVALA